MSSTRQEIWTWKNKKGDILSAESVDLLIKLVEGYKKTKDEFTKDEFTKDTKEEFEQGIERRRLRQSILKIIRGLEKEYGEGGSIEEVLDLAEKEGMEREKAEDIIKALKNDGFIYAVGEILQICVILP